MVHNVQVMRYCVDGYLSHMRYIHDDIRAIKEQIDEVKEIATGLIGMAYDHDSVSTSTEGDKIGEAIAKIEQLQLELAERVNLYYDLYDEAERLCAPHYLGRYVLWLNRVKRKKYAEIAMIVKYSEDYVYELAAGGIVDLYYAMPESYRRDTIPNAQPR